MATTVDPIRPRDRLWFGVFLALAIHATLILGVSLESTVPEPEVILSVSLSSAARSEPQLQAELQPETDHGTAVMQPKPHRAEDLQQAEVPPVVATPNVNTKPKATLPAGLSRNQLIAAIADAPLEDPPTPYTKRTRRLDEAPLTAPTTDAETAYLAMWRRKCERLGRLNYPPGNIQGELLMQVSIFSNGHLDYVRIARSSGSSLLDEAALQTVRQAAPYQPFSVEMRKAYDRLEFTRTWQYSKFGTDINR